MCAYTAERLRKYDKALSNDLKTVEIDKNYSKAYFGMGDNYITLDNAKAAISTYSTGLELEPADKRAQASLELAQIKYKAATGDNITAEEFIRVMEESKKQEITEGAIDGSLLRMQIHFHISSAKLTDKALTQLVVVGKALDSAALKSHKFEVAGHTDISGTPEINLTLSKEHAEVVRGYLLENFAIEPENLTVAHFGDTRPASPNNTATGRALNRRVKFKRLNQ